MKPSIKKFIIKGLFGKKDVELSFENSTQIFIGENGLGKTTMLNSLYYVLSCDFQKLSKINFVEIEVHFKKDKVKFSRIELLKYLETLSNSRRRDIDEYLRLSLKKEDISTIKNILDHSDSDDEIRSIVLQILRKKGIKLDMPYHYLMDIIRRLVYDPSNKTNFNEIRDVISQNITSKILYFPTYRRIEEELQNLGDFRKIDRRTRHRIINDNEIMSFEDDEITDNVSDSLIQFGMSDVEKRIETITQEISKSSILGFSKLTGDMLVQLLRGYSDLKEVEKINIADITIILDRVGNNLSREDKNKIIELISSNKIFETENKQLIYFLEKLLMLYKSQSHHDTAIKSFRDVCNGYLNEKHYEYNESAVDLRIFSNEENGDKKEVLLSQLSSGEKQIVSLFSKIYLEPDNNFIVLFDEPELSLSIFWQKKLLPDILKSDRCDFLLAVTHSPFIFENELQKNTIGLKEFFLKTK
ncbi:MAG: AAA family ATPase [Bacteroides graminisolvens]|uniref:AAA family ATPase n=1 Tax=Bacteroides graminisolvens TaxID=477666 RepID=UPI003A89B220